jgi:hypothetical protein
MAVLRTYEVLGYTVEAEVIPPLRDGDWLVRFDSVKNEDGRELTDEEFYAVVGEIEEALIEQEADRRAWEEYESRDYRLSDFCW